jgi:ADP-heptose:LPS heptosyltransferase
MGNRGNQILRFVDFYCGIPLVLLIGAFHSRRRTLPEKISRIGILATAAIGDTVLMSAVLKDLRKHYSRAHLAIFSGPSNAEMVKIACPFDDHIPISTKNIASASRTIRRHGPYDLWMDFGPWPRLNALLTSCAPSHYAIGFNAIRQHRHYVYDEAVPHTNDCHEIENLRRLVEAVGVSSSRTPSLPRDGVDMNPNQAVVHMFPGGFKSHFKEWDVGNWKALIDQVTGQGIDVVLTGSAEDRAKAEKVRSTCRHREKVAIAAGTHNLYDVCRLLESARVVVSVNTGIMHMAAAYRCHLLALHGPTSVRRWGPLDDRAVNLCATSPSAGCLHLGFEYDRKDRHSLDTITVEQVIDAFWELWRTSQPIGVKA